MIAYNIGIKPNASGTIIGSKFVQLLEQYGNAADAADALLDALKR